jgi:dTDP-4-dehydrorhamnose 3,5-epimerase-like enzyme
LKPHLVEAGIAVDDRGRLTFANTFSLTGFKRFYTIENHHIGFVRAWHGHQRESKAFFPLRGAFVAGAVAIDDWINPSLDAEVSRVVLASDKPELFVVPPGYANGTMSLTQDALLLVFSSHSLGESIDDDFRFAADHWDIWQTKYR